MVQRVTLIHASALVSSIHCLGQHALGPRATSESLADLPLSPVKSEPKGETLEQHRRQLMLDDRKQQRGGRGS
jgi:hypothetical protein